MKGWRKTVAIAALGLIAGALGFIAWKRHGEPRYQGKTTAEWFQQFRSQGLRTPPGQTIVIRTSLGVRIVTSIGPPFYPPSYSPSASDTARNALRQLGTNAVPYLSAQVRRRDGIWERVYPRTLGKLPLSVQKALHGPPSPRDLIRRDAAEAISALGANGVGAVPALLQALRYCEPMSEDTILSTLRRLDYRSQDADELIEFLTRKGQYSRAIKTASSLYIVTPETGRCLLQSLSSTKVLDRQLCVYFLGYFARHASVVLPGLTGALKDPSRDVRLAAARMLEEFGVAATPAMPVLAEALRSDDSELRYLSARALEAMGTNAFPAVPLLIQATNDSFTPVRTVSGRILKRFSSSP